MLGKYLSLGTQPYSNQTARPGFSRRHRPAAAVNEHLYSDTPSDTLSPRAQDARARPTGCALLRPVIVPSDEARQARALAGTRRTQGIRVIES